MKGIFFLFLLLFLIFLVRLLTFKGPAVYLPGQIVRLSVVLSGEPQNFGQSQRFEVEGVKVVTSRYPAYHYGDRLEISGVLEEEKPSVSRQIDSLLKIKEPDLKLNFPQITLGQNSPSGWFWRNIFSLRQNLVQNYRDFLPEPAASLLTGIVLGVKTQMSSQFRESLRQSGLTHVVVASGMNISLVIGFFSTTLTFFWRRQWALPVVVLAIFLYALLAGFEAPIVRAMIMGVVALLAQSFGRQNWPVATLILTGLLMLIVSPRLLFDLGFQLSFLATAGLVLIQPILGGIGFLKAFARVPLLGGGFLTTLSAQLATLPLILANFGYWSSFSLLVNTLVLWTVPWIMGLGAAAAVLGLLAKPLGQLAAFLTYPLLFYFEKMAAVFSQINFLSLENVPFPHFFTLAYFSFLIAGLVYLKKKPSLNE